MIKTVPQPDDEVPSGRTLSSFGSRSMSHLPGMKATLWFSNIELQTAFNSFHRKEIPLESLSFFVITLSCFIVIAILGLVYNPAKGMTIPLSLALYFGVAMVVCGWIFLYCKYCAKYFHKKSTIPWDYYSRILQNVYIILLSLFFALRLYARVDYGQCGSTLFREYIYCNPNADRGGFPEDSILGATIILPMYTSILRDTSIITTTVAYMILSTSFIYTAIIGGALSPVYIAVGFYMLMTAIILYSNQKQNIRSFIVQQQLSAVIKQNEEMAEELRANELRHMIGNVAHDLKTPLASFVSGLDVIVDIVQDELKKLAHILDPHPSSKPADHVAIHSRSAFTKSHAVTLTSLDVTEIQETLKAVLSTVQNNRNINNFMMMTINRCIDYTKASRGLKLVPKYETVDLLDTLFLPFKCMGDVSQKVRISLEPLSSAICSHVITDKQWLQENVLCLLSNAVKYSAGGTVNGRMILTTAEAVGPSARCHIISTLDRSVSDDSMHSITTGALSANILDVASNSHASRSIRGRQVRSAVSPAINEDMEELDTPQGVAEMRKLELEHAQQVLLVEIEDTGIGMADEAMANLFDAFKRAQKFAGGTGLGLFSLAKRIEALGGSYGVRRRENGMQGSLFWFTIPYRPDEQFATLVRESSAFRDIETRRRDMQLILEEVSSKVPVTLPLSQNASAVSPLNLSNLLSLSDSSSNKGLKILIVDDSASIQKMMSMMLRRHGHVVDQAENGAIAVSLVNAAYQDSRTKMLERLTEAQRGSGKERVIGWQELMHTPYDVVLMDLQMPVMDGLEAMERIRKVEKELIVDITRICADTLVDALFDADEITLFEREPDWGDEVKVEEEGQARSAGMKGSHENRGSLHLDFNNSNHTKHAPPKQLISKLSNQRLSSCQLEDIQVMLARSCHQLVLGVSANSDTDTMQDALSAGADAFISKPFSIDSFYATYNKCFHITNRVYKPQ